MLFAQKSAIILYKGLYVRVKSDVPKYFIFLDNRHLVSDVSRKERVALAKNKIPPNQLLGLSLVYMKRISSEIVYSNSDTNEVKIFWFIKLI